MDGMLPDLAKLIQVIAFGRPDAHIIVATRDSSFVIFNEAVRYGTTYISDVASPGHFIELFREASARAYTPSDLLGNWLEPAVGG